MNLNIQLTRESWVYDEDTRVLTLRQSKKETVFLPYNSGLSYFPVFLYYNRLFGPFGNLNCKPGII